MGRVVTFFPNFFSGILGIDVAESRHIFRLFAVYTIFTPSTFVFLALLRSEKRSLAYSIFTIVKSSIRLGLIIVFLVLLEKNLLGLYQADAILSAIFFPILIIAVFSYTKGFKFSFSSLRSMLLYSIPLVPNAAFFWVRNMLDRLLIQRFLTESDVGIYGFAVNFPNAVSFLFIVPLGLAWLPYAFSLKDETRLSSLMSRILTYFILISGWVLVILGGGAYDLLRIIAKHPGYWNGAPLVPVLILGICIYGVYYIISTSCHLKRRTIFFTIATFVGAIVSVVLNIILLPRIGLMGAAVASVLSFISMLVTISFFSSKLMKVKYETPRIIKITVVACLLTSILFLWQPQDSSLLNQVLSHLRFESYWYPSSVLLGFAIKFIVGTVLYFGGLFALGILNRGEKDFLGRILHIKRER